jgi:hypothetical protein
MRRLLIILALVLPLSGCVSSLYLDVHYYPRYTIRYDLVCPPPVRTRHGVYTEPCYYMPVRVPVL